MMKDYQCLDKLFLCALYKSNRRSYRLRSYYMMRTIRMFNEFKSSFESFQSYRRYRYHYLQARARTREGLCRPIVVSMIPTTWLMIVVDDRTVRDAILH